jgi:hypothetical protein
MLLCDIGVCREIGLPLTLDFFPLHYLQQVLMLMLIAT